MPYSPQDETVPPFGLDGPLTGRCDGPGGYHRFTDYSKDYGPLEVLMDDSYAREPITGTMQTQFMTEAETGRYGPNLPLLPI